MLRIYLDTQIVTYLKNAVNQKNSPYEALLNVLKNNEDKITIFYSLGHLSDYLRDKTDYKNEDLEYMSKIGFKCFINYNLRERHMFSLYDKPFDVYYSKKSNHEYNIDTHFEFLKTRDPKAYEALLSAIENMFEFYKTTLINYENNSNYLNRLNEVDANAFKSFVKLLPYSSKDLTLDIFKEAYKANLNNMKNSTENEINNRGIKMQDYFRNKYGLNNYNINFEPYTLKGKFENTELENLLVDHMGSTMLFNGNNDFNNLNEMNFHTSIYMLIGNLGLVIEKSRKFKLKNIISDAEHSFFGSYCDIVVTNDLNFAKKSKVVYGFLSFNTLVMNTDEFINYINEDLAITSIYDKEDIIKLCKQETKNFLTKNVIHLNEDYVSFTIDSQYRYLGFFNSIIIELKSNAIMLRLTRITNNYINLWDFKEIESATNCAVKVFGIDTNNRGKYDRNIEYLQINKGVWPGRRWYTNGICISLIYKNNDIQLTFGYMPINLL